MATQNPKIVISELGQEDLVREMTTQEISELDVLTNAAKERREEEAKAVGEKEAAKTQVLAKLGLTQEEAKALLG